MSTEIKSRKRTNSKKGKKKRPKIKRYDECILGYDPRDYDGFEDLDEFDDE